MAEQTLEWMAPRTHDSSSSGIDIVRTFYVDPYQEYPAVTRRLHGFVEWKDGKWKRTPPAHDTYVKNCYCERTRVNFAHPDAACSADELSDGGKNGTIIDKIQKQKEALQEGTAGAIITAHYRPLITAWRTTDATDTRIWDWIDPKYVPGIRQIPWPGGMHAAVDGAGEFDTRTVPDEAAQPIAVPVSDFSVKRILVGEPPWIEEKALCESINAEEWPTAGSPAALGLGMTFPAGTLKFIDMDIVNMVDSEGGRWFEVTLNFKWLHYVSARMYDKNGKIEPSGHVTWNHMLMRPTGFPVGWYSVFLSGTRQDLGLNLDWARPGMAISEGRLHHTTNFDNLFKLNP